MKKFLAFTLAILSLSSVFAGWIAEVPDQWYLLSIDGKEEIKVDSCSEALSEAIIQLNNGAKRIVISPRFSISCLRGCCKNSYTDANSAEKALKYINR